MSTLKRGLEETSAGAGDAKKIKAEDDLTEIRVLINNVEASVIIGKAGANVKQVRVDSGAFVSILKNESSSTSKERVMTVKGANDAIGEAMRMMLVLLIEADAKKAEGTVDPEAKVTSKLLIHKFLAGSIIGKGGEIIREIQESTQAHVSLSKEPMGSSTEKTVSITGSPDTVTAALARVLTQLSENPLREGCSTVLYKPDMGVMGGGIGMPMGFGGPGGPPPAHVFHGHPAPAHGHPAGPPAHYGHPPSPYPAPQAGAGWGQAGPAGDSKTEKIVIPTVCAGTVIGKGGCVISDIKARSGTHISIGDPSPTTPEDRIVSVTGSKAGIATALQMIRVRVESYTPTGPRT